MCFLTLFDIFTTIHYLICVGFIDRIERFDTIVDVSLDILLFIGI